MMPKIKKGIHRCWGCKKVKACTYRPDPYREEIDLDKRPVWECENCWEESADAI
jgi:hypothetical protein